MVRIKVCKRGEHVLFAQRELKTVAGAEQVVAG